MEAKFTTLNHNVCEWFPIVDMPKALNGAVELPIGDTTMNVSIHEDNDGK